MKVYRNFDTFANLKPLEFEVPMICLVTGAARDTRIDVRYLNTG
jgi:hypothetical protein